MCSVTRAFTEPPPRLAAPLRTVVASEQSVRPIPSGARPSSVSRCVTPGTWRMRCSTVCGAFESRPRPPQPPICEGRIPDETESPADSNGEDEVPLRHSIARHRSDLDRCMRGQRSWSWKRRRRGGGRRLGCDRLDGHGSSGRFGRIVGARWVERHGRYCGIGRIRRWRLGGRGWELGHRWDCGCGWHVG